MTSTAASVAAASVASNGVAALNAHDSTSANTANSANQCLSGTNGIANSGTYCKSASTSSEVETVVSGAELHSRDGGSCGGASPAVVSSSSSSVSARFMIPDNLFRLSVFIVQEKIRILLRLMNIVTPAQRQPREHLLSEYYLANPSVRP